MIPSSEPVYRMSLADAQTLVIAKVKKVPALFAVKEKEIIDIFDELKRELK